MTRQSLSDSAQFVQGPRTGPAISGDLKVVEAVTDGRISEPGFEGSDVLGYYVVRVALEGLRPPFGRAAAFLSVQRAPKACGFTHGHR